MLRVCDWKIVSWTEGEKSEQKELVRQRKVFKLEYLKTGITSDPGRAAVEGTVRRMEIDREVGWKGTGDNVSGMRLWSAQDAVGQEDF